MFEKKTIAILGLGKSGLSSYDFFAKKNFKIFAWDDNESLRKKLHNKGYILTNYCDWDFQNLDFIIVSPGISIYYPKSHYIVKEAEKYNILITTDIEIFIQIFSNKKYIAITGTNGKSTTVSLIYHIFKESGKAVALGGNIGRGVFGLDVDNIDYIILELSSYQLSLMYNNKFDCVLFLNIKNDHLDYHGSFDNYYQAKENIFRNQDEKNIAVVSEDIFKKSYEKLKKQQVVVISIEENQNILRLKSKDNEITLNFLSNSNDIKLSFKQNENIIDIPKLNHLRGIHNQENIAFAYSCANFFNISNKKIVEAIMSFKSLEHRQEVVRKINNIIFVNDSKATNQQSTFYALRSFQNIYLILGGKLKEDNLDLIIEDLKRVQGIFLIGSSKKFFQKILSNEGIDFIEVKDLKEAVIKAYKEARLKKKEATILLSPACSSFDEFKNFEERGDTFKEIVHNIS